ncbi:MAG: hypothetical protein CFH14_00714 [Alphaproteobacteria bacterium MarineAlpha5_Bin4]|nr:MAG: hypothetical protein CFH14_00714 [Alphaproteobacteria bacterium MarineAlpha5_Bin4]
MAGLVMRLLLIILLFSSIAYAKEKDLICKSLTEDKVKYFIKADHYKCIFQNIKFEKISLKPYLQFSISNYHLLKQLKLNNSEYKVVGYKAELGQVFQYKTTNKLNQNIVHIYKKQDQLGNITETNILIIRSKKPTGISFINNIFKLNLNNYIIKNKVIPNQNHSELIENTFLVSRYEAKDNNQEESAEENNNQEESAEENNNQEESAEENNNQEDINDEEYENENEFLLPLIPESQ